MPYFTDQALVRTLKAAAMILINKSLAILLLVFFAIKYQAAEDASVAAARASGGQLEARIPFADLYYAGIIVMATLVAVPVVRLLFFPEVAHYAETGVLKSDLDQRYFAPALVHYWLATGVSFIIVVTAMVAMQYYAHETVCLPALLRRAPAGPNLAGEAMGCCRCSASPREGSGKRGEPHRAQPCALRGG